MSTTTMYRALLNVHWKHQRKEIVVAAIASAMIAPIGVWRAVDALGDNGALALLSASEIIGLFGAVVTVFIGLLLAIRPYALDAQGRHAYPLSLPVQRASYALLRAATGLTLALLPAAGFLIGNLVAAQALPQHFALRVFPFGLAARFMLATVVAFGLGFAVQYGLGRRAARWLVIVALTIGVAEMVGGLMWHTSVTSPLWDLLASEWSPLRVFMSRWMLFDV